MTEAKRSFVVPLKYVKYARILAENLINNLLYILPPKTYILKWNLCIFWTKTVLVVTQS